MTERANNEWWLQWARRAQQDLGALLAETIDNSLPPNEDLRHCVRLCIAAERELAEVLEMD